MSNLSRISRFRFGWPNQSRRTACLAVMLAVVITAQGCSEEPHGQGPGKREQVLALTSDQELEAGRRAYQHIIERSPVLENGPEIERVQRVSQRISQAVNIEPLQREINFRVDEGQFEWEYAVIDDDQVNAFCLPGGKIVVLSGLLKVIESDDELASVIAHEVAHVLVHHASERIAREREVGRGLLSLAYNREQESEADHIGVFLMTFAGYDPDQSVEFWRKMQSARGSGIHLPELISDHPSDARRLKQLQTWVEAAKAGKQAYDSGRIAPP